MKVIATPVLLTRDELVELTGSPRRTRIIAWLVQRGWRFETRYDGWPVVARAEMEGRLAGISPPAVQSAIRWDKVA